MRRYLESMLAENRVRVVEREVSGQFELAAVTQASQRESDAPLLFRRVAGSRYPVMTNIFGSRPRLTKMLGGNTSFCKRWMEIMATPVIAPVDVAEPNDLEEIRLSDLPPVTYFELDAGPYLTAGVYLANEPDSKVPNLSFHRADHQRH
jgi:UbiD family decarboxylase